VERHPHHAAAIPIIYGERTTRHDPTFTASAAKRVPFYTMKMDRVEKLFPDEIMGMLLKLSIDRRSVKWNIGNDGQSVSLNVTWNLNAEVNDSSVSHRKSPSTIQRDRKRMNDFLNKRMSPQNVQNVQPTIQNTAASRNETDQRHTDCVESFLQNEEIGLVQNESDILSMRSTTESTSSQVDFIDSGSVPTPIFVATSTQTATQVTESCTKPSAQVESDTQTNISLDSNIFIAWTPIVESADMFTQCATGENWVSQRSVETDTKLVQTTPDYQQHSYDEMRTRLRRVIPELMAAKSENELLQNQIESLKQENSANETLQQDISRLQQQMLYSNASLGNKGYQNRNRRH